MYNFERDKLLIGMVVRSSDGDKLGKIESINDDGFTVEKGIFFPKSYFCRFDQIDGIQDDDIYLRWGTQLVENQYDSYYGAGSYKNETADDSLWSDYDRSSNFEVEPRQHMSVPLREEELDVQRGAMKEVGRVRIVKTIRTEDKHFTVPIQREEVRVERVAASDSDMRPGNSDFAAGDFESKTIDVPVREEEVTISKRPVVKEHLKVDTVTKTVERPVSGEVRKEEANIERDGDGTDLKRKLG